jgi:hypothetical protein
MSKKLIETKINIYTILKRLDDFIYIVGDKIL